MTERELKDLADTEGDHLLEICLEIASHTGPASLNDLPQDQTRGYEASLERNILILKLYLTLCLQFLGMSPAVCMAFSRQRSVISPELSISALAYSIWVRIKYLVTETITNEVKLIQEEGNRGYLSEESQTESLSLTDCENCEISKDIVRELVSKVEGLCSELKVRSFIGIIREQLQPRMHEITAWAAMTFWYEAIMVDIESISRARSKGTKGRVHGGGKQLRDIINKLESQLGYGPATVQGREIKNLEEKALKLKNQLVKKSEEAKELATKLESSENAYKELEKEVEELRQKSQNEQESIKELEKRVVEKIEETTLLVARYEKEIDRLNRRIELSELEKESKQLLIDEQYTSINLMERKIQEYLDNEAVLNEKVELLGKNLESMSGIEREYSKLKIEFDEKVKEEKKLITKLNQLERDLKNSRENDVGKASPLEGDVRIDTAIEKVSNEQKIKFLRSKNKKLQCTLDRIFNERNTSKKQESNKKRNLDNEINQNNEYVI